MTYQILPILEWGYGWKWHKYGVGNVPIKENNKRKHEFYWSDQPGVNFYDKFEVTSQQVHKVIFLSF